MRLFIATLSFGMVTSAERVSAGLKQTSYQHFRMGRESWLVYTAQDAAVLCNLLSSFAHSTDEIVVTEVASGFACRLGDAAARWIRSRMPVPLPKAETTSTG